MKGLRQARSENDECRHGNCLKQVGAYVLRVAIPVWEGRVSPVLDVAGRLLLVDADDGQEISRSEEKVDTSLLPQRVRRFCELGVEVVICGAVSRPLADMLHVAGITVHSCIMGDVESVLNSYLHSGVPDSSFSMPGYDHRGRRRWHGKRDT
jgi:predicted Fe-Mo cluster-binding NifX family protein